MPKRRKLPEEDLAASVADMIRSPITRANLSFLQPDPTPAVDETTPMGLADSKPMGVSPEPPGNQPSLSAGPSIQQALPLPGSKVMWRAERIGTVFESGSRLRRIERAEDALSPVEEKVYNLLWGAYEQGREEFRLVQYSLQRISTEARVNIKTVREMMPRLVEKGFLEIAAEADVRRNIPTTYRIWSLEAVLTRLHRHNRFYVVRTGKGVLYAHPMQVMVSPLEPMGLESIPNRQVATPTGQETAPLGAIHERIASICRQTFGSEPDHETLVAMVADCHQHAIQTSGKPATEAELLHFAAIRAEAIRKAPNIRNHMAVLRKTLPDCFTGAAYRAYRSAASELASLSNRS